MKCELCGRECSNLEDDICCLERSMHPHLFKLETELCDNCGKQSEVISEKMEKASS